MHVAVVQVHKRPTMWNSSFLLHVYWLFIIWSSCYKFILSVLTFVQPTNI